MPEVSPHYLITDRSEDMRESIICPVPLARHSALRTPTCYPAESLPGCQCQHLLSLHLESAVGWVSLVAGGGGVLHFSQIKTGALCFQFKASLPGSLAEHRRCGHVEAGWNREQRDSGSKSEGMGQQMLAKCKVTGFNTTGTK